MMIGYVLMQS